LLSGCLKKGEEIATISKVPREKLFLVDDERISLNVSREKGDE